MHSLTRSLTVLVFLVGTLASAQTSMQRYYLESVGFEYLVQKDSPKRCAQWRELRDKSPIIEFENGAPYVMLELEARLEGTCPLKFPDQTQLEFSSGTGELKIFKFKVTPPSVAYTVSGPGFTDQLIFEALISQPEQVGFFDFFKESQTKFDLGYGIFTTDNLRADAATSSIGVFPIMSGQITVPVPFARRFHVGFSLLQNLSNLISDDQVKFQVSEFNFDLRYLFGLGIPGSQMAAVLEARGRNWYQLGAETPFVVRSSPGFGAGLDYDYWHLKSPVGFSLFSRYGYRKAVNTDSRGEIRVGGSVNYKLSSKWALGAGYKWSQSRVDFSDSSISNQRSLGLVNERSHLFHLSLILLTDSGSAN